MGKRASVKTPFLHPLKRAAKRKQAAEEANTCAPRGITTPFVPLRLIGGVLV